MYPSHIATDLFKGYNMMGTMTPEYVASNVLDALKTGAPVVLLPGILSLATFWQAVFPAKIYDMFMMPTNSSLDKWEGDHANKIFSKMNQ